MGIISGMAVFFMIWWTTLFVCLPLGRSHEGQNPAGSMSGAPTRTNMRRVIIINTLLTVVIWIGIYILVASDDISFLRMAREMK